LQVKQGNLAKQTRAYRCGSDWGSRTWWAELGSRGADVLRTSEHARVGAQAGAGEQDRRM